MRRDRRNNAKKERVIMIASSVFVLSALTMTGIYMKSNHAEEQDDGYTIDFTELEENVQDKYQEIAQNNQTDNNLTNEYDFSNDIILPEILPIEDDLDYVPMEAGSGQVEIPGLTDGLLDGEPLVQEADTSKIEIDNTETIIPEVPVESNNITIPAPVLEPEAEPGQESAASNTVVARTLQFSEENGLIRPLTGEVLIPFSENLGSYFYTLNQYKWSPAIVISAMEGTAVAACAEGKVVDIFRNEEIGQAVTMELGDGYQVTYGQLKDVNVAVGDYVEPGEVIAAVAAPTIYYVVEGSNLYLELTKNGDAINPEGLFR